jgi:Tfp pilus assembly protein PilO
MALRVSERERKMLLVLFVLLAVYLLYAQVYVPTSERLSSLEAQIETARLQARTMRVAAQSVDSLRRELADLQYRLDLIWQSVGREPNLPWLVASLEVYAEAGQSRLISLRPQTVVEHTHVAEMPFEITLEGTFEGILAFLRQAENGHPAIAFTRIAANRKGAAEVAVQPELSVVISGKTYFRAGENGGADQQ